MSHLLEFCNELEPNHLYTEGNTTFVFNEHGQLYTALYPLAHKNMLDDDGLWASYVHNDPELTKIPADGFKRRGIAEKHGILGRVGRFDSPIIQSLYAARYKEPLKESGSLVLVWTIEPRFLKLIPALCKALEAKGLATPNDVIKILEYPATFIKDFGKGGEAPKDPNAAKSYSIDGRMYTYSQLVDMRREYHMRAAHANGNYDAASPLCKINVAMYPELEFLRPGPCAKSVHPKAGHPLKYFQNGIYPPNWHELDFSKFCRLTDLTEQ